VTITTKNITNTCA